LRLPDFLREYCLISLLSMPSFPSFFFFSSFFIFPQKVTACKKKKKKKIYLVNRGGHISLLSIKLKVISLQEKREKRKEKREERREKKEMRIPNSLFFYVEKDHSFGVHQLRFRDELTTTNLRTHSIIAVPHLVIEKVSNKMSAPTRDSPDLRHQLEFFS